MFDKGGADEDAAVEVGEHPLGAGLGAVDGDDPEVLRTDGLDTWGDAPCGFPRWATSDGPATERRGLVVNMAGASKRVKRVQPPLWKSHWLSRLGIFSQRENCQIPANRKSIDKLMVQEELRPMASLVWPRNEANLPTEP